MDGAAMLRPEHLRQLWTHTDRLMNLYNAHELRPYPSNPSSTPPYDGCIEACLQACWDTIARNKTMDPTDHNLGVILASQCGKTNFWPAVNQMFVLVEMSSLVAFHYDVQRGMYKILRLFHRTIVFEAQDEKTPTIDSATLELFPITFFAALKDETGFTWDALWRAKFESATSVKKVIVRWFVAMLSREVKRRQHLGHNWADDQMWQYMILGIHTAGPQ
ncbi:hypothetical protein EK21DRAFT_108388 [Setomelanomma holmii]|uniref:Uncharacterized protein n=1 Tax=Setomelanomma holmii TaxID=210430 RepID=A0A9P4HF34_9PLEO|nr:hypothetical protein EK21DRAFT_108388 [Setomelanomma holmii]